MSSEPQALLPCPFCGAPARDEDGEFVACTDCGALGPDRQRGSGEPEFSHHDKWNRRVRSAAGGGEPQQEGPRNNVVACASCKNPVQVTALNAIRCEACTNRRVAAGDEFWFRELAKQHDKLAALIRADFPGESQAGKPTNPESVFDTACRLLRSAGGPAGARERALEEAARLVDEAAAYERGRVATFTSPDARQLCDFAAKSLALTADRIRSLSALGASTAGPEEPT